jgi:hypothetical protein
VGQLPAIPDGLPHSGKVNMYPAGGRPRGDHSWLFCALESAPGRVEARASIRRYTGDRRSPSPSGRITLDTQVIIADTFGPICGDDHPRITGSARPDTSYQAEFMIAATVNRIQASE